MIMEKTNLWKVTVTFLKLIFFLYAENNFHLKFLFCSAWIFAIQHVLKIEEVR